MKILITADSNSNMINGVVISYMTLYRTLKEMGHDVRVLTISSNHHTYQEGDFYYLGSVNAQKLYPGLRLKLPGEKSVISKIYKWHPDIIHSQTELATFLIAVRISRKLNIPLVHTYHTVYEQYTHYFPIPGTRFKKAMVRALSRDLATKTDVLLGPSAKITDMLDSYNVKAPLVVLPNGIDISNFLEEPSQEWIKTKKQELGIPEDNFVMIFLGRIAQEKNIDELIDYMHNFNQENITLLLVGGGPHLDSLKAKAQELGINNIVYTGMVAPDEVPSYYHLGDCFVNASTSEAYGMTYLEAMSSGLPCVCRKDTSIIGVVENDYNGWQYETEDEFVAYINQLKGDEDLYKKISDNCTTYATENFTNEVFAKRAIDIYENAITKTIKSENK